MPNSLHRVINWTKDQMDVRLKMWWPLDASQNPQPDLSMYDYKGTPGGSAVWIPGGYSAGAYQFISTQSRYVMHAYPPACILTNNFTVMAWVKWSAPGGSRPQCIICNGRTFISGSYLGVYNVSPYNLCVSCSQPGLAYAMSDVVLPIGVWTHVAAVKDAGVWKIYMNGVAANMTGNPWFVAPTTGVESTIIGVSYAANSDRFIGDIDEPMVFDYVLTGEEITRIVDCNLEYCKTYTPYKMKGLPLVGVG